MEKIILKNIYKSYILNGTKKNILKDINIEFEPNKLTYIIGESGSGKSTLLNILGCLDTYEKGQYFLNNIDISNMSEQEKTTVRNQKIGFIFQNFNLINHLSAIDNISLAMEFNSVDDSRRKALELLTLVGMEKYKDYFPSQLSGGQKQRIAIARALSNDPDIILADEPTGALDSENSILITEILKEISKKGKTVIVVTHSQELLEYGDAILTLKDGMVINYEKSYIPSNIDNTSFITNKKNKKNKKLKFKTISKMVYKNILNKKWRNFITGIAASIGIAGVLIILALSNGINQKINSVLNQDVKKTVINVYQKNESENLNNNDIEKISNITNVDAVLKYSSFSLTLENKDGKVASSIGNTLVPPKYNDIYEKTYLKYGEYPSKSELGILIPESVAKDLFGSAKKSLNKSLNVTVQYLSDSNRIYPTLTEKVIIKGVSKDAEFNMFNSVGIAYDLSNKFTAKSLNNDEIPLGLVIPNNNSNIAAIKDKIKEFNFESSTDAEGTSQITEYVSILGISLGSLSAISLIVSSLMISIVLYVSVVERTKEIGILKAIGGKNKDIRKIFILEGTIIGAIGGIIGSLVSGIFITLANIIIKTNFEKISFDLFKLDFTYILIAILFSALLGTIASLIPAYKASRKVIREALLYE